MTETCKGESAVDFVAVDDTGTFVGWSFVWRLDQPENVFGLVVADSMHGRGLGRKLSEVVLAEMDSPPRPGRAPDRGHGQRARHPPVPEPGFHRNRLVRR